MENSLLNSQCSPGLACGPQTVAQRHPLKLQTPFRVAHVLRKYNPSEWGGTETAVHRLVEGLRHHAVESVVFAPHCERSTTPDPLKAHGHAVKRFRSFLPVSGISKEQRRQLIAIGGNLMSFELGWRLLREPGLTAIHTHCLNRLGAISLWAARRRRIPLVVTIHGGALDLPDEVLRQLAEPLRGGWEWGKPFGALLRSRRLLELADAVLTCNPTEAKRLREKWPAQRVLVQPHSVPVQQFATDHREAARHAFPAIGNRRVLLSVGRIDPVKNQIWLVEQLPKILRLFSDTLIVLAGAFTDAAYARQLEATIRRLRLENEVMMVGGLPPGDPRLIGLLQQSSALVLPSRSETFGLVLLEAWAAGTPVLSSRTSGALALIEPGNNGWLFDLDLPDTFHHAVQEIFARPDYARGLAQNGRKKVEACFDATRLAEQIRDLYAELLENKR